MSLKVIGLISGGKDSLYSLAHCIQNGHKVVALATLHPPFDPWQDGQAKFSEEIELDSNMYQSVGHSIVPLYEEALGICLHRQAITGTATQRGRYYDASTSFGRSDETEDMYRLVSDVLKHHPEANALSSGAILSTYQRSRVESIAVRLGLISLAYLWQYPYLPPPISRKDTLTGLLDDMYYAGCDARIVRGPLWFARQDLLYVNITDPINRRRLLKTLGLPAILDNNGTEPETRAAVLGEGGEYETLALDGPSMLWKKRIDIKEIHVREAPDGTGSVQFANIAVADRGQKDFNNLPVPVLLDVRFAIMQTRLSLFNPVAQTKVSQAISFPTFRAKFTKSTTVASQVVQISNLVATERSEAFQGRTNMVPLVTAAEQFEQIMFVLPSLLKTIHYHQGRPEPYTLGRPNIVSTTLLLDDIESFDSVNQVYRSKLWPQGYPIPPARVTIATPLADGVKISLSLVLDLNVHSRLNTNRDGLHVQSRSYWAPANIGPYSQAVTVPVRPSRTLISTFPERAPGLLSSGDSSDDISVDDSNLAPTFIVHGSADDGLQADLYRLKVVHMAGQIPLNPASMLTLESTFRDQTVLALQHLWRIGQERCVDLWVGVGVAYLARINRSDRDSKETTRQIMLERVQIAAKAWLLAHQIDEKGKFFINQGSGDDSDDEDDDEFDVWDRQQRQRGHGSSMTVGEHLHKLPNHTLFSSGLPYVHNGVLARFERVHLGANPPFIAAEVSALPRNASIEWWSTGLAGLVSSKGDLCGRISTITKRFHDNVHMMGIVARADVLGSPEFHSFFLTLVIDFNTTGALHLPSSLDQLLDSLFENNFEYKLSMSQTFLNLSTGETAKDAIETLGLVQNSTIIPCYHVWASKPESNFAICQEEGDSAIKEVSAAVVMRVEAWPAKLS